MPQLENPLSEPINKNLALETRFKLVFQRLPHASYFCKSFIIPGVNMGEAIMATPLMDMILAGDKIIYDPLVLTLGLDEDWRVWEEINGWITGLTFPEEFKQYSDLVTATSSQGRQAVTKKNFRSVYGDCTLLIQTSAQNTHVGFKFFDVFPISLGAVQFNAGADGTSNLSVDLTLRFTNMQFYRGLNASGTIA